jgi:hypothetical protein
MHVHDHRCQHQRIAFDTQASLRAIIAAKAAAIVARGAEVVEALM